MVRRQECFVQDRISHMERKDLFLNNDLSMMLSRDQNMEPDFVKEWVGEQLAMHQEADEVIKDPIGKIDAKQLMERSARYAEVEGFYLKLYTQGTDVEQSQDLRSLEYAASLILLPDAIFLAGGDLVEKEDYAGWLEVLYALHYVPLQKAFCYCLTRHQDFASVLSGLDIQRMSFPQTFLWSLLDHWFEWLTRVGGHLLTYEDEKGFHDNNKKAQELKAEAKVIREEWEKNLPGMVHEIMVIFSKYLPSSDLLSWATREPLRDDARTNPYSANYNHCMELIYADLSKEAVLNMILPKDFNLNMLLLMSEKAVANKDEGFGKEVYNRLIGCLLNENFSGMEKKSELDEKRQRIIAQLVALVNPSLDFAESINAVATRFQGWNLDHYFVYYEARREAYMLCALFRVFEIKELDDEPRFFRWKNLVDVYLHEYRRCENEYIVRDEFAVPFRVAVEVVEKLKDDKCREYLHQAILENVLSIVSLLIVFSECSMHLSAKTVARLLERIEIEWPSAKMLMEVRGQRSLEGRIEDLIEQLKRYVRD